MSKGERKKNFLAEMSANRGGGGGVDPPPPKKRA